ncbi:MAG: hypothetical protein RSD97_08945 [Lachnospiraceae bacterium]
MANVLIVTNVTVMAADEKANNEIVSNEYVNKTKDLPPLLAGIGSISDNPVIQMI